MAKELNKSRMMLSRVLVGIVLIGAFLTVPAVREGSALHALARLAGYVLLVACAIGRIYSTAFIGGVKNKELMTEGPYSTCRNPLYFYSLLGAAGVGLMSAQAASFVLLFGGFLLIYDGLIRREEEFLAGKFGEAFAKYKARVPRLWPKFRKYTAPAEMVFQPKFLTFAVRDAIWWFAPVPLFELASYLRHAGIVKPLFVIY